MRRRLILANVAGVVINVAFVIVLAHDGNPFWVFNAVAVGLATAASVYIWMSPR